MKKRKSHYGISVLLWKVLVFCQNKREQCTNNSKTRSSVVQKNYFAIPGME